MLQRHFLNLFIYIEWCSCHHNHCGSLVLSDLLLIILFAWLHSSASLFLIIFDNTWTLFEELRNWIPQGRHFNLYENVAKYLSLSLSYSFAHTNSRQSFLQSSLGSNGYGCAITEVIGAVIRLSDGLAPGGRREGETVGQSPTIKRHFSIIEIKDLILQGIALCNYDRIRLQRYWEKCEVWDGKR